jgi:hypothetical protein
VEAEPGIHPVPALPSRSALVAAAGSYLDPVSAAPVELGVTEDGQPTATVNGFAFGLEPAEDGRLRAARGVFEFCVALSGDGTTIEVESDAGHRVTCHRVPACASLPPGLEGAYRNDEIAATWTIRAATEDKASLAVEGPLVNAGPWSVHPVEGDVIRITVAASWYRGTLDTRVLRGAGGEITGLRVSSGRVKDIVFSRLGA